MSGLDKLVLQAAGSDAAMVETHGEAAAECCGPSGAGTTGLEEATASLHKQAASSDNRSQPVATSGAEHLAGPLACPVPLATSIRRHFKNEVVLVQPSDHRLSQ